jgi:hypothetical protein
MPNLTIGRYDHESITKEWAGWIEPADRSWIIYTDADGKPSLYFAAREADGAVIGDGVKL